MSNLLNTIIKAQGGAIIGQLAKNFGISPEAAEQAVSKLLPAVSRGIQKNAQSQGGLESILGAITGGNISQYLDNPTELGSQSAVSDGNNILGQIFGSKDVSRNVAGQAAKETGLDVGILKKMLPLLASTAIASISKQASPNSGAEHNQGLDLSSLVSFLDADKDGSVIDDVLNLAKRFI